MHLHESQAASRTASPDMDDDALLTGPQVRAKMGGVSDMCLWRWRRDERLGFPQPITINRRNYWSVAALRAWQAKHADRNKAAA